MLLIDHIDEGFHGPVVEETVIAENGGEARAGELGAVEIVVTGYDDILRDADFVLLEGFEQAHGHFIIGADEGIGQGKILLDPLAGDICAVGGAPGFFQNLDISVGIPFSRQASRKPSSRWRPSGQLLARFPVRYTRRRALCSRMTWLAMAFWAARLS